MMKYLLILTFTLIFISCYGQDYKVEKQLFECLVSSSEILGIDLKKELFDFENHLIEIGILKDNSGNSYYQIYKHIEKEGDINFSFNYSFLDTIRLHSDSTGITDIQTDCTKNFEKIMSSNEYKKSKLHVLKLAMDSIQKRVI